MNIFRAYEEDSPLGTPARKMNSEETRLLRYIAIELQMLSWYCISEVNILILEYKNQDIKPEFTGVPIQKIGYCKKPLCGFMGNCKP